MKIMNSSIHCVWEDAANPQYSKQTTDMVIYVEFAEDDQKDVAAKLAKLVSTSKALVKIKNLDEMKADRLPCNLSARRAADKTTRHDGDANG
jgi:hypothetical protein